MSPPGIWRSSRLELRGLAVLTAGSLVAVGLVAGLCQDPAESSAPDARKAEVGPPSAAAISASSTPRPAIASKASTQPNPATLAAASKVASAFATAFASYSWNDGPQALRQRLRPYDSDRLDASFEQGGAGGLASQELVRQHAVATAQVLQLYCGGFAQGGRLGFVAQVRQSLRTDAGTSSSERPLELLLIAQAGGWRVDEVHT